jgi:membrane-bound metal-dependent hydrolase YbcI (DUF457 family)
MFVGHYGPALAIKRAAPLAPMWALMASVQIMDVVWAIFIQLGVEKARIDPAHALAGSPLVLYHMPYTHSLVGAALICLAFALIVKAIVKGGGIALVFWVFLAGFSHWLLDLLVHAPDLTIAGGETKFGLGLWAYKWPEFALEFALLAIGFLLYLAATKPRGPVGRVAPWVVIALLVIVACYDKLAPVAPNQPEDAIKTMAWTALAGYTLFIACGAWLDRVREAK